MGQHAGMVGQHKQEWWVNMRRNLHLQKEKEFGTIEKNKLADLVLLDANPLENITNAKRIFGVVVNGRLLRRPDLDSLLQQAEAEAKK